MLAMRAYELMIIFDGDLAEPGVDELLAQVNQSIGDAGGQVATTDNWGKRKFAYEIDHKHEGFYVVLELVTDGQDLSGLERQLRLADEVVRHKLLRLPDTEAARKREPVDSAGCGVGGGGAHRRAGTTAGVAR